MCTRASIVHHDSAGPRVSRRDNAQRGGTKARTSACCRSCCWAPRRYSSFSRNGPDCTHRRWARARLVGSFRALSSRSSSSTSLLTWVARTMIRRSRLFSRATPRSCFLRRERMILPARILYTCRRARIRLIYFARFAPCSLKFHARAMHPRINVLEHEFYGSLMHRVSDFT